MIVLEKKVSAHVDEETVAIYFCDLMRLDVVEKSFSCQSYGIAASQLDHHRYDTMTYEVVCW